MPHSIEDKKRAINRLRRIKGQTEALERAIEEGMECRALLQQIAALRGAANGLMAEVLDSHLQEVFGSEKETAVTESLPTDPHAEIDEIMMLLSSYIKYDT